VRAFGPGNQETLDESGWAMVIGTIDAVRRYPVKSLRGESLQCARVGAGGLVGDRASALFVTAGDARVGKAYRGKEHDRLHLIADKDAALGAAAARGVTAQMRDGDHFFDDAPVSILVDRWLEELRDHVAYPVEWERFRPNFYVRATPEFSQDEMELQGAKLKLGSVRLLVRCPIERCVTVTYHPRGGHSDPRILRFLAQRRNAWMGIYCDVLEPGEASVGDLLIGDLLIKEAPLHS
jgi:uncharacterized protein